jgi:hypothetical protein
MLKDRVLTEEFASRFLADVGKWGKHRSRDRGLE